jgi:hypothetical protein
MLDIVYEGGKACLTSGQAHGGGGPISANRVLASVRSVFSFDRGLIERNPAAISGPGEEQRRDRVLSDDDLAAVLQAAACMPSPFGEQTRRTADVAMGEPR